MKIFVANLDFKITEAEFREIFSVFGAIIDCKLIAENGTQKSKGYGFVRYKKPAHALQAIKMLNGTTISGRTVVVRHADNRKPAVAVKPKRPRIASLPYTTLE